MIGAIGLILAAAGTVAIVAHAFLRDDDGYYTASTQLEARSYALTTDDIDLDQVGADVPNALVGKVRLQASSDDGKPLFLGIAPTADVNRYLSGVGHRQVSEISTNHDPRYEDVPGSRAAQPARSGRTSGRPAARDLASRRSSGTSSQATGRSSR